MLLHHVISLQLIEALNQATDYWMTAAPGEKGEVRQLVLRCLEVISMHKGGNWRQADFEEVLRRSNRREPESAKQLTMEGA